MLLKKSFTLFLQLPVQYKQFKKTLSAWSPVLPGYLTKTMFHLSVSLINQLSDSTQHN